VHKAFRYSTKKFRRQSIFQRCLFESDFSAKDCAALHPKREIPLERLEIIEWRLDLIQKAEFRTFINYPNLWVSLLSIPDYRNRSQKAISVLVRMPTTYFSEKGFSALVNIESKKRNSTKAVDLEK